MQKPKEPLKPKKNPPAPNRSAASLRTVFVGGVKTRVTTTKKDG